MTNVENKNSIFGNPSNRKTGVRFNVQTDLIKELNTQYSYKSSRDAQPKFRSIKTSLAKRKILRGESSTDRIPLRIAEIEDKQIKKALDDIQQRGCTFYKFGFLSDEKKGKKRKVFGDYFNLKSQQMKGLMSVGELWSSKQRSNYLKQNKIYVNKVKLLEKINNFKKQDGNSGKKICSINTFVSSPNNTFTGDSLNTIKTVKTLFSDKSSDQAKRYSIEKHFFRLKKQIRKLHDGQEEKESMTEMFRKLEKQNQSMDNLEKKYFLKLIQML